jgi:hypothetical protein
MRCVRVIFKQAMVVIPEGDGSHQWIDEPFVSLTKKQLLATA